MKIKLLVLFLGICSIALYLGNVISMRMAFVIEDDMLEGTVKNVQFKAYREGWEAYRTYDAETLERVIVSHMMEENMTREIAEKSVDPDCDDQFAYYTCTVDIHNKSKLQVMNVDITSQTPKIWFWTAALSEGWVTLEPDQAFHKEKVRFVVYVGDKSEEELEMLLGSMQVSVTYARGQENNRGSSVLDVQP